MRNEGLGINRPASFNSSFLIPNSTIEQNGNAKNRI